MTPTAVRIFKCEECENIHFEICDGADLSTKASCVLDPATAQRVATDMLALIAGKPVDEIGEVQGNA